MTEADFLRLQSRAQESPCPPCRPCLAAHSGRGISSWAHNGTREGNLSESSRSADRDFGGPLSSQPVSPPPAAEDPEHASLPSGTLGMETGTLSFHSVGQTPPRLGSKFTSCRKPSWTATLSLVGPQHSHGPWAGPVSESLPCPTPALAGDQPTHLRTAGPQNYLPSILRASSGQSCGRHLYLLPISSVPLKEAWLL